MLMFLLLSCQDDYDMAISWHLEQIPTEERRHGIIHSGSRWLLCTEVNSNPHLPSKTWCRRAVSISDVSYHFPGTVIFASPSLYVVIDEGFSVFVAYWLDFPARF